MVSVSDETDASEPLNGDLRARATEDTNRMDWTPSPSGTVWRKRVHCVGPAESGQVTSVVRYDPGATFSVHDHPEGEEILVLGGVFSDEHGDWPAGTYLLNPEGFRHAPFSREGCLLFVKLRQFEGTRRRHVALDTNALDWEPDATLGIECKPLYDQPGFADTMRLERWQPGTDAGVVNYEQGVEIFVLEGDLEDEEGNRPAGSWLRLPAGAKHQPRSSTGCTLYVKRAGLGCLRSATDLA